MSARTRKRRWSLFWCVVCTAALYIPLVTDAADRRQTPDILEDNYDPAHAAPIAVQVPYELNFICPDSWPGACPGGDHDYLRVPVKSGQRYVVATYDLGPGADTVLELFWGDETTPVAANDDAYPNGFASLLTWRAPADGAALIRVAPRNGGALPLITQPEAETYHVVIALAGSDLAETVKRKVAAAAGISLATPRAIPAPAAPAIPVPGITRPTAPAVADPTASATALTVAAASVPTTLPSPTSAPTQVPLPQIVVLDPPPLPAPPAPPSRVPLTVAVELRTVPVAAAARPRPLVGVRVQLVSVFGDVLAEALTGTDGTVALTRDLPPATAARVRVALLGLELPIDLAKPTLAISVREEGAV